MVFYFNIDPTLFWIGKFPVRYYGLMYLIGIIFVWWFIRKFQKNFGLNLDSETIADLVFAIVLGLFIGGRLGYVLFYNFGYYMAHPIEIPQFWKGGMSFHGGFFLSILILYLFCRFKKLDMLKVGDLIAVPLPIALAFGRLGNFLNGELWGRPWYGPWAFIFPRAGNIPRHPSQFYEILKNLTIFGTLLSVKSFRPRKGTLFFGFFGLYGVFRIIIEFFREPEIVWLGVTMGQWLCVPMIIFSICGLVWIYKRKEKKPRKKNKQ